MSIASYVNSEFEICTSCNI